MALQLQTNRLLTVVRIYGFIVFLFQTFLFLLYYNWPYEKADSGKSFGLLLLAFCLVGYLFALWRHLLGGWILIVASCSLAIFVFANGDNVDLSSKFIFLGVIVLPSLISGILFLSLKKRKIK